MGPLLNNDPVIGTILSHQPTSKVIAMCKTTIIGIFTFPVAFILKQIKAIIQQGTFYEVRICEVF